MKNILEKKFFLSLYTDGQRDFSGKEKKTKSAKFLPKLNKKIYTGTYILKNTY